MRFIGGGVYGIVEYSIDMITAIIRNEIELTNSKTFRSPMQVGSRMQDSLPDWN